MSSSRLTKAIRPELWSKSIEFASGLFEALDRATRVDGVLARQPYGQSEQAAHDLIATAAEGLGLLRKVDVAGNLHLTFPGRDENEPAWITGSHLDSVPDGGNFDGAAGVIAPISAMHAWRAAGVTPRRSVTVIAFRAEEASSWFTGKHHSHFGSRALLGQLTADELHQTRSLTDGRSLSTWMQSAGFDPTGIRRGTPLVDLMSVYGFVELHIEQGPVLVNTQCPTGVVSGIRGTLRARAARCLGEDAHSGAVPLEYRRDALFAAVEFAAELERRWHRWLADGSDGVCTLGRFGTDPERHSMTKIPGEVSFTIEIRSLENQLLVESREYLQALARRIGQERCVRFELGSLDLTPPVLMDANLQRDLFSHAITLGISTQTITSGAGHDAANFASAGVPTAMVFLRNDRGSHNRHEEMTMEDFSKGTAILERLLQT